MAQAQIGAAQEGWKLRPGARQALAGVRIIDCTRLLPGAFGSQLLADLGAEVIKVEEPGQGEPGRASFFYEQVDRHKKSLTLDLKRPEGKRLFEELVGTADVVFESFRPGVMQRLGLDYSHLRSIRPALVYCAQSGFGQDGPDRSRPAHNLNFLALSGLLQADHDPEPVMSWVPVADIGAGSLSAVCILAALHHARATGEGQYIDVSLLDVSFSFNLPAIVGLGRTLPAFANHADEAPGDHRHGLYRTSDGRYLVVAGEHKFWKRLVTELGLPHLADLHNVRGERARAVKQEIQSVIATQTLGEWEVRLATLEVCVAPVYRPAEAIQARQAKHRGQTWRDGASLHVGFPARFSATPARREGPAPAVGQHSEEILRELGHSTEEIAAWRAAALI
jgi:alpha-methylacyl-CoA racemase